MSQFGNQDKAIMSMIEKVAQDIDTLYDYRKDNFFTYIPKTKQKDIAPEHEIAKITNGIFSVY